MAMTNVDDTRAQAFVDWAIQCATRSSTPDQNTLVWAAWQIAMKQRKEPGYDDNYNLGAAEHYLYARFLAGRTGDPMTQLAPALYDMKKLAYTVVGQKEKLRIDKRHAALGFDYKVLQWGNKGARDGLSDYKAAHPEAGFNYGSSIAGLAKDAKYSESTSDAIGRIAIKSTGYLKSAPPTR